MVLSHILPRNGSHATAVCIQRQFSQSTCLSVCSFVCLSICQSVCHTYMLKNATRKVSIYTSC